MANAAERVRDTLLEGAGAPGRRIVPALLTVNLPPAVVGGLYLAVGRGRGPVWAWGVTFGLAIVLSAAAQIVVMLRATGHEQRSDELAGHLTVAQAQSERRRAVADLLVSLARRNQSLLERQLELIDDLESREQDPAALTGLFRIDHFATRMRRNAESLLVLSGSEPGRRWADPLNVSEVIRGAVAEVEDYTRVDIAVSEDPPVAGRAVSDVAHLLAELIENAAAYSPPEARVEVNGRSSGDGYEIRVEDHGVGMTAADLTTRNLQLVAPADFDVDVSRMLGLHVVSRLSARHGMSVVLEANRAGGVTAVVSLPGGALHDARAFPEIATDIVTDPEGLAPHSVTDLRAVGASPTVTPNPTRHTSTRRWASGPAAEAERRFFGSDPRAPRPHFTIPAPPPPPPLNRPMPVIPPPTTEATPPWAGDGASPPSDGARPGIDWPLPIADRPVPVTDHAVPETHWPPPDTGRAGPETHWPPPDTGRAVPETESAGAETVWPPPHPGRAVPETHWPSPETESAGAETVRPWPDADRAVPDINGSGSDRPMPHSDRPAPHAEGVVASGAGSTTTSPSASGPTATGEPGTGSPLAPFDAFGTGSGPEPAAGDATSAARTPPPGAPLVRRIPQTHLAPAMLGPQPAPPAASRGADPDLVRSRLSSYQHGLRSGRQTAAEQEQAEWTDDPLAFGSAEEEW